MATPTTSVYRCVRRISTVRTDPDAIDAGHLADVLDVVGDLRQCRMWCRSLPDSQ
jgi:hypothetical protein